MINIQDYSKSYTILNNLYKNILLDKDYFQTHDINALNEEKFNLLGLALKAGHEELANYLIDNGANINQINERGEHLVRVAIDMPNLLLKILASPNLENKKFVFKQAISICNNTHIYFYDETFFSNFLNSFDLTSMPKEYLIEFAARINQYPNLRNFWSNYNSKHSIGITVQDIGLYLLKEHEKDYRSIISNEFKSNKKHVKRYNELKKHIKYILSSGKENKAEYEFFFKNLNRFFNYRYFHTYQSRNTIYDIEKIQHNFILKKFCEDFNENKENTVSIETLYNYFYDLVTKNTSFYPKEKINLKDILDKYSLHSLVIPKHYRENRVYQVLDNNLPDIADKLNIDKSVLGVNNLILSFKETTDDRWEKGLMKRMISGLDILEINFERIFHEIYFCYDFPGVNKHNSMNTKEMPFFKNLFMHEYTHFLQYANGILWNKNFNFKHTIQKKWQEVTKEFNHTITAESCKDYFREIFKSKINEEKLVAEFNTVLDYCFKQFNTNYKKDKNYINAKNLFENFIKKIEFEDIHIFKNEYALMLEAYINQNKSSFQRQLWKKQDMHKPYFDQDVEIHARLNQQFLGEHHLHYCYTEVNETKINFINPIQKDHTQLKIKLQEFNKLMTVNINKLSAEKNKAKRKIKP